MSAISDSQYNEVQRMCGELVRFGAWQSKAEGRALIRRLFEVERSTQLSSGQAKVLLYQMRQLLEERLKPPANMVPASEIRWV
jgi:hypothetical protein